MKTFKTIKDINNWRCKTTGKIGFVPTMGALHQGHLSLVDIAKRNADVVVVSIFVNPLQFGKGEDLKAYPEDIKKDVKLLEEKKVDVLFMPDNKDIYPENYSTYIEVPELSSTLCGKSRPGHFRGVCTVVCKLFNIVKPDMAVFGEKDAQQLIVIQKMVKDLNLGIKIITGTTVREKDGLAMSSRNVYLSRQERKNAPVIYQALKKAEKIIKQGEKNADKVKAVIKALISSKPTAKIDYIEIVHKETLEPVKTLKGRILIAVAVRFGKARLIDNITIFI